MNGWPAILVYVQRGKRYCLRNSLKGESRACIKKKKERKRKRHETGKFKVPGLIFCIGNDSVTLAPVKEIQTPILVIMGGMWTATKIE